MNEEPNKTNSNQAPAGAEELENIEDVLLEFDKEPELGGEGAVSAAIEPSLDTEAPAPQPSSPTPSPFGPPIADLSVAPGAPSGGDTPSAPPQPNGSSTNQRPSNVQPTQPATPVIQDIKPSTTQAPHAAPATPTTPAAPIQDEIKDMVADPKPASPASSAIESLLSVREKAEGDDGKQSKKDIKLPSTKKPNKALLWIASTVVVLLAGAAAGWFFMVKTPADQAAANYRSQAISYLESIEQTMGQFSGDVDETLESLNSLNRPKLENTLLNSFSYSAEYSEAENLQTDVNNQASQAINGVRALSDLSKAVSLGDEADAQLSGILNDIDIEGDSADTVAAYQEYVSRLQSLKSEITELEALTEPLDIHRNNVIAAIDKEIAAYSPLTIANQETQTEGTTGDSTESEDTDTLPVAGDEDEDEDTNDTDGTAPDPVGAESGSEDVVANASQATADRRSALGAVAEFLASNTQPAIEQLRSDLASFIANIK